MTVSSNLKIDKDDASIPTYGIDFCDQGSQVALAAATELTLTVPLDRRTALFQYSVGTNVFILEDDGSGSVTIPGGAFTSTEADLNPIVRNVTPGQTLHFISDTPAFVKISFYI